MERDVQYGQAAQIGSFNNQVESTLAVPRNTKLADSLRSNRNTTSGNMQSAATANQSNGFSVCHYYELRNANVEQLAVKYHYYLKKPQVSNVACCSTSAQTTGLEAFHPPQKFLLERDIPHAENDPFTVKTEAVVDVIKQAPEIWMVDKNNSH